MTLKQKIFYKLSLLDEKGDVEFETEEKESESFVIGYSRILETLFANRNTTTLDINNVTVTLIPNTIAVGMAPMFHITGAAGDTSVGIVLGTGTTAVASANFRLAALIAHGTAAGQLSYAINTLGSAVMDGVDINLTLSRDFINNSGADIIVRETGIHAQNHTNHILIVRDVIPAFTIPNLRTARQTYTFRTTL